MSNTDNKVFVIPDTNLNPLFFRAKRLMDERGIKKAVILGDVVKNGTLTDVRSYNFVFRQMQRFMEEVETYFCYGEYEAGYLYDHTDFKGYNPKASLAVYSWLLDLRRNMRDRMVYAIRIGKCLFSHAGLSKSFLERNIPNYSELDIDAMIDILNGLPPSAIFTDDSPLLMRQSPDHIPFSKDYLQVVGHSPVENPCIVNENFLLTDTISTCYDGMQIGSGEFVIVDTEKMTFETVKI